MGVNIFDSPITLRKRVSPTEVGLTQGKAALFLMWHAAHILK
jgi:hypothetical protein